MWRMVRGLRENGVTIVLTTHYIVEAEEMADRVGVINKGEIILVENKDDLMRKLGSKQLTLQLADPLDEVPAALAGYGLELASDGADLVYTYDSQTGRMEIADLLADLSAAGVRFRDLQTKESSLEEIFVDLVKERRCISTRYALSTSSRWQERSVRCCRASSRPSSPRRCTSWSSARP